MIPRGVCIPYTVCPVAFREKNLHFPLQDPARDYPLSSYLYLFGLLGGFCPLAKTPVVRGQAIKNFVVLLLLLRSRGSKGRRGGGISCFLSLLPSRPRPQTQSRAAKLQKNNGGGRGRQSCTRKDTSCVQALACSDRCRGESVKKSCLFALVGFDGCRPFFFRTKVLFLSPPHAQSQSHKKVEAETPRKERERKELRAVGETLTHRQNSSPRRTFRLAPPPPPPPPARGPLQGGTEEEEMEGELLPSKR